MKYSCCVWDIVYQNNKLVDGDFVGGTVIAYNIYVGLSTFFWYL